MAAVFDHHNRHYGTRRLQIELRENGHRVGRQALRTGLRRHGRRALQPKAFAPRTTDSTHGQRCAPSWLLNQPRPAPGPGQPDMGERSRVCPWPLAPSYWTYYLCAFQGVCTKHVVSWQVRADIPDPSVTSVLQRSLLAQRPASGLIVYSDRGGSTWATPTKRFCMGPTPSSHTAGAAMIRQCLGRKPLVPPQNRGVRSPRLARLF